MQRPNGNKALFAIPSELLDDISSRFLLDAPDSELGDPISLCFLTELAYWFYLDEYVEEDDSLNTLKFDVFALQLLQHVKIKPNSGTLEEMLQDFRDFKLRVPTYGALILNSDKTHVLLVQGFWHRASWGFPKGKINVEEEPHKCAIREVLEETGFDITSRIDKNVYLETTIGEQRVRLYIILGVSMATEFIPRTKGEIKELKWFPLHQLPSHKHDRSYSKATGPTNMFYMVMPFVKPLREWLATRARSGSIPNERGGGAGSREARRRHRSLNINSDNFQKYTHNSPCSSTDPSKTRNQIPPFNADASCSDRLRFSADPSPSKKETKSKAKGKKNILPTEIHNEDQEKFTFKSRGKSKGSHSNVTSNVISHRSSQNSVSLAVKKTRPVNGFISYSWQNFKINKKAINDALDQVWSGVHL